MLQTFLKRCRYRYGQFCSVMWPQVDSELLREARSQLPPRWQNVFDRFLPSEFAHVLRLYRRIKNDPSIVEPERSELILLALCHDFGKTVTRPGIFERIMKTLLPIPNNAHPILGARILKKLGAPGKLVQRVLNHHKDPGNDRLLALFQKLDDNQ